MNKDYTTIPHYINSKPKAIYELYFNSQLKRKVVNSSRSEQEVIAEILEMEPLPHHITFAKIIKKQSGETTIPWYYEREKKRVYDMLLDQVYDSARIAENETGILKSIILAQCFNKLSRNRRFRYAVNGD